MILCKSFVMQSHKFSCLVPSTIYISLYHRIFMGVCMCVSGAIFFFGLFVSLFVLLWCASVWRKIFRRRHSMESKTHTQYALVEIPVMKNGTVN